MEGSLMHQDQRLVPLHTPQHSLQKEEKARKGKEKKKYIKAYYAK